ncbi:hypothetical protein M3Y99_00077200 [Aphelenchoides fujianensis]|nr:hypothetical protein M3Y99_00077200 [Aphelenchoides fujianensis]
MIDAMLFALSALDESAETLGCLTTVQTPSPCRCRPSRRSRCRPAPPRPTRRSPISPPTRPPSLPPALDEKSKMSPTGPCVACGPAHLRSEFPADRRALVARALRSLFGLSGAVGATQHLLLETRRSLLQAGLRNEVLAAMPPMLRADRTRLLRDDLQGRLLPRRAEEGSPHLSSSLRVVREPAVDGEQTREPAARRLPPPIGAAAPDRPLVSKCEGETGGRAGGPQPESLLRQRR